MNLSEFLGPDRIRVPLRSRQKEDVLRELVELLPSASGEDRAEQILEAVIEREKRMSTGIGKGVAIPHGKTDLVPAMEMAFGIAAEPVDFESLDGDPCAIFFLLVSPPELTGPHIKALAQISRMLTSDVVRDELAQAPDAEAVLALFRRHEAPDGD